MRPINVLVVDDEEINSLYMQEIFNRLDANVIFGKNGVEAISLCRSHPELDLVLMDIRLPQLNGYEATKVIKEEFPNLPIIAQTACAMLGDKEKALAAGCDDYIAKPIRIPDLIKVIAKHTENEITS